MPDADTPPRRSWRDRLGVLHRQPRVLEGISVNDDFTDRLSDVPDLILARGPAWLGVQEIKRHDLAELVDHEVGWPTPYDVRQDLSSEGRAGVAVVWDALLCRPLGEAIDDPDELGGGWLELTPAGGGLTARGVVWQDLVVRVGWVYRTRIRIASAHRPPQRNRDLWPLFDQRLAAFCHDSPHDLVVFMDCNEAGGPDALVKASGLSWHGHHFDGALTNLTVPGGPVQLARRHSDHHAESVPTRF